MRIVFFGTPAPAVPGLDAVADAFEVAGVVTQPDRARGRRGTPQPSAVKARALERGLPVLQPRSPREDGFAEALRSLRPDVLAVIAYGHILPPDVLGVAPAMNVHFSLLPRYRGAAPVQRALMAGETRTGVSVFLLEPTIDTGPVVAHEAVDVGPDETAGELLERLAPLGAGMLLAALEGHAAGSLEPVPQDPGAASPAPKITPADAVVDWGRPADVIVNQIRALNPAPGAFTTFRGKRLLVWRGRAAPDTGEAGRGQAGTVVDPGVPSVAAGDGTVVLVEVQPEGKKRMGGDAFARGYRPSAGERCGEPAAGSGPQSGTVG